MIRSAKNSKGVLEVICGSMFSGKSEELIRRLKRAEFAKLSVLTFKPNLDTRHTINALTSHSGDEFKTIPLADPLMIFSYITPETDVVGIDEVQFFPPAILNVVCTLIEQGKRIILAGLDLDFRGMPFGCMPIFMAIADQVTKLKAICISCGQEGHFTQRLVNGFPAKHDDPLIMIGAQEHYQARCRGCYSINQKPLF